MPAPTQVARAGLDRLPAPVQRRARDLLTRVVTRRAMRELEPFLARVAAAIDGFDGKRVVEIGSDGAGGTLRAVAARYAPLELIGLNPASESRTLADRIELRRTRAETSGLRHESVDAVFSSSAFEHIDDLAGVLREMHRVLVPGGRLYSHFGPIWSTSYGHHLWVTEGARRFTYHDVLLPPWAHLLLSPEQVHALLEPAHGAARAARMRDFIFGSDEQNGLFFDDYERIVEQSPFQTCASISRRGWMRKRSASLRTWPHSTTPARGT